MGRGQKSPTMEVTVDTFGPFREVVGRKSVTVELAEGATVCEALAAVVALAPELGDRLFEDGVGAGGQPSLAGGVVVTHAGESIAQAQGLETPVADGDVVRVTQQITGG